MPAGPVLARLLLADGRFPSGASAHSGGVEAAVAAGLIRDLGDLGAWVTGCLHRQWLVEAAAAVAAARLVTASGDVEGATAGSAAEGPDGAGHPGSAQAPGTAAAWTALDVELTARTTAPLQRHASRVLGRQLLRAGRTVWPHPVLAAVAAVHPDGPALPLVQGAVGAIAGLAADDIATTCLYGAVQGAATAAVRLLGLNPYAVTALVAAQAGPIADVVARAVTAGTGPIADLPAAGGPMTDVLLATHATADMRLFTT